MFVPIHDTHRRLYRRGVKVRKLYGFGIGFNERAEARGKILAPMEG